MITTITEATELKVQELLKISYDSDKLTINNDTDLSNSVEMVKRIVSNRKSLEAEQADILAPMKLSAERVKKFFAMPLGLLVASESRLRKAITDYSVEQTRLRRIEAEQAAAKLERERRERELKADALRAKAELAPAGRAEYLKELADAHEEVAAMMVVGYTPAAPKMDGVHTCERWSAEVTDFRALVQAVANGQADIALLQPNMPALNGRAKALRNPSHIPGVKFITTTSTTVRG